MSSSFRDLPPPDRFPHGTRARYVAGKCRCESCTKANRDYARGRYRAIRLKNDANPLVSAARARRHLRSLGREGVGRRAIAAAAGVSENCVWDIAHGKRRRMRRRQEQKLLAVARGADLLRRGGHHIDATATWALLDGLIARGFTRTWIARALGNAFGRGLQVRRDRIRVSTARKVEQIHRTAGAAPPKRNRWQICECLRPEVCEGRCSRCERRARPDGAAAIALGGSASVNRIGQAFGWQGGWSLERRPSKKAKKREDGELRRLAGA